MSLEITTYLERLLGRPPGAPAVDYPFRPDVSFRGLSSKSFELQTTLQRLSIESDRFTGKRFSHETDLGDRTDERHRRERRLLDSYSKYARPLLRHGTTDWDVLMIAQHYRLPTRLLDWTLSPLVALHFACQPAPKDGQHSGDGRIWCVSRLGTRARMNGPIRDSLQRPGLERSEMDLDMIKQLFPGGIAEYDEEVHDPLAWLEPTSVDERIVNQFAMFSIVGRGVQSIDDWLREEPLMAWSLDIAEADKPRILRQLYLMNVTERTLFPGLEGVADWQRNYYSDFQQGSDVL